MKKFKPKYTEKTAIKKIRDILFTLSADAVKYTQMKINAYEIDSIVGQNNKGGKKNG